MTIIFFGNSAKSLIGARIIHEKLGISCIVTVPDRIGSRGKTVISPLNQYAQEKQIPHILTSKLTTEVIEQIAAMKPDFLVVEDYGLILPQKLLDIPKYAPLNVHHSLLPKYRGPAPAPYTILAGETVSGVSIIHMNNRVDAGDIYAQQSYTLLPDETTDSLLTKLNELGGALAVTVIQAIVSGKAIRTPQDESTSTMTRYMHKNDGYIALDNPPDKQTIDRMIRAYFPWPGVWLSVSMKNKDARVKLLPGGKLQMEGKSPVSMKDFLNGYPSLRNTIEKVL